jgi:hypothetical protein
MNVAAAMARELVTTAVAVLIARPEVCPAWSFLYPKSSSIRATRNHLVRQAEILNTEWPQSRSLIEREFRILNGNFNCTRNARFYFIRVAENRSSTRRKSKPRKTLSLTTGEVT